jgi:hypothetical protein
MPHSFFFKQRSQTGIRLSHEFVFISLLAFGALIQRLDRISFA